MKRKIYLFWEQVGFFFQDLIAFRSNGNKVVENGNEILKLQDEIYRLAKCRDNYIKATFANTPVIIEGIGRYETTFFFMVIKNMGDLTMFEICDYDNAAVFAYVSVLKKRDGFVISKMDALPFIGTEFDFWGKLLIRIGKEAEIRGIKKTTGKIEIDGNRFIGLKDSLCKNGYNIGETANDCISIEKILHSEVDDIVK